MVLCMLLTLDTVNWRCTIRGWVWTRFRSRQLVKRMPTSDQVEPVGQGLGDYDSPECHQSAHSDVVLPQDCLPIIHRDGFPRGTLRGESPVLMLSYIVTDHPLTRSECYTRDPTNESCQYCATAEIARSQGSTWIRLYGSSSSSTFMRLLLLHHCSLTQIVHFRKTS